MHGETFVQPSTIGIDKSTSVFYTSQPIADIYPICKNQQA